MQEKEGMGKSLPNSTGEGNGGLVSVKRLN